MGRLQAPAPTLRLVLNGVAVGILVFLVWDVLSAAWEPIDAALGSVHAGDGGLGTRVGLRAARRGRPVGRAALARGLRALDGPPGPRGPTARPSRPGGDERG